MPQPRDNPSMFDAFRRYFDVTGRSRRREFWLFVLLNFAVYVVLNLVFGERTVVHQGAGQGMGTAVNYAVTMTNPVGATIASLYGLFALVPSITVSVRRLHDQDRSGWLLLLALVPLFGWFALFVLMLLDGTRGPNRFGPDPKGRLNLDVFR